MYGVDKITRIKDDPRLTTTTRLSDNEMVSFKGKNFDLITVIQKIDSVTGHAESVFIPEDVGRIQLLKLVTDDRDKFDAVNI